MPEDKPATEVAKSAPVAGTELVAAIAVEVAKQLPMRDIYEDGVAQPLKEAGGLLTDVLKTVRLILAPFQYGAAMQDRYRAFLDRTIARVPKEDLIEPPPQILGPVLEGIRYEPEGTPIWDMWSELLSRACDSARVSEAHPAFPGIIAQLSPDEAKLLSALAGLEPHAMDAPLPMLKSSTMGIQFPSKLQFYLNHLSSLGLIIIPYGWAPMTHAIMIDEVLTFMLSPLGLSFVAAVTSRTTG